MGQRDPVAGLFAEWQPLYAELGIATFPVREKRPAVSNYLKMGVGASNQLRTRFDNDDAFGFACKPSRITVLDVDGPDERLLADALSEFGPTPIVVRSGSGNWQAWYRNAGEGRKVRPDASRPIDILGGGYVVAPPSQVSKGRYRFVEGSLEDLHNLPKMARRKGDNVDPYILTPSSSPSPLNPRGRILVAETNVGQRNNMLWREAMQLARRANTMEELGVATMSVNVQFYEPLPDAEVANIVASAWRMQCEGRNRLGEQGVYVGVDDILSWDGDHALRLFLLLRASHGLRQSAFAIAHEQVAEKLGVDRRSVRRAIETLLSRGVIRKTYSGGKFRGDPHLYVLTGKEAA